MEEERTTCLYNFLHVSPSFLFPPASSSLRFLRVSNEILKRDPPWICTRETNATHQNKRQRTVETFHEQRQLRQIRRLATVSSSSLNPSESPAIVVVVVVVVDVVVVPLPFVVVGRMISDATCRRIVSPRAFRQNFLGGIIAIVIKILGVKRSLQRPVGIRAEMSKSGGRKSNRGVERIYRYIDIDIYRYT